MIRALHISSVLMLALAAFVLAVCIIRSVGRDVREVAMPSAIERFRQVAREDPQEEGLASSPLLRQAQALASYLNPAPVPAWNRPAHMSRDPGAVRQAAEVRPASSSVKFELHGISYHRSRPAQSMALVWEPGRGRRWVRQGEALGHLVIERIDGDRLVWRDGERTHEMALRADQPRVQHARGRDERPGPRWPTGPVRSSPLPPRGIRQMPASRIAAKMGVRLAQMDLSDRDVSESE